MNKIAPKNKYPTRAELHKQLNVLTLNAIIQQGLYINPQCSKYHLEHSLPLETLHSKKWRENGKDALHTF